MFQTMSRRASLLPRLISAVGRTALALVLLPTLAATVRASGLEDREPKPDLDVRIPTDEKARGGFVMRAPTTAQRSLAHDLDTDTPGLRLRWDGMSGAPKWMAAPPGEALSPAALGDPEAIARAFLRKHAALYGLQPLDVDSLRLSSVVPAPDGGWHVYMTQFAGGLEVFGGRTNVNLAPDGSVRSIGARLYAAIDVGRSPVLVSADAVRLAMADLYPRIHFTGEVVRAREDGDRRTVFHDAGFGRPPEARLVVFPEAEGARLAWEIRVAESTMATSYRVLVDAIDGTLLHRVNTTVYAEARYLDAEVPDPETEEFVPDQHVLATVPSSTAESPNGWIDGDGTSLAGNNATSHLYYLSMAGLAEPGAVYDYRYNTPSSALVNAWWWANDAHDRFYDLGFNEAAGNFQQDNFGLGGVGGDAMKVVVYTTGTRTRAFSSPSVDGGVALIYFSWANCRFCADHDGYPETVVASTWLVTSGERSMALMRDEVFHEYTHGVSIRRAGGPADDTCLRGIQSSAMGEAWSDLFGGTFFDDPQHGGHVFDGFGENRDLRNDSTYDDLCAIHPAGCEEHADGMIWGGSLWDLRESMRALDPVDGLEQFHRIVVQGLAEMVCQPSMVDALDGLLAADTTLYGSVHHGVIWNVFATRGLGENADSTGEDDTSPVTDYTVPAAYACTAPPPPSGLAASPEGANALRLDFDATGAAAVQIWREDLDNPWDRPVQIGSTDSLSTYLDETVQGGRSYRYHTVALGTGGVACTSAASATAEVTASGDCLAYPLFAPGLTITGDDPGCWVTLDWSPATPGCPGSPEPIVYDVYRAPTPGFEPSDMLHIGSTTSTTFSDKPPEVQEDNYLWNTGNTSFYLVLARHGALEDPPDHRRRGSSQILQWVPGLPATGRTTAHSWDFETGAQGWTTVNAGDPVGGWTVTVPNPTYYAGALLAPDEAAGGSGQAWVTGDAGGPSSAEAYDCDGAVYLISPTWDGTGGATLLSFDHWTHNRGLATDELRLQITNGTDTVEIPVVLFRTTQPFETSGRYGWQRAEFDLARFVAPTSTMGIAFETDPGSIFTEFGIDNVRVDSATTCARSSLRLGEITVDDSPAGWGNGNGVLEPGETARLTVELDNDGSVTAFSPVGRISSSMPGLLVHEETAGFPDIAAAASGVSLGDGFIVTAMSDAGCEETLAFDFEFTDAVGTTSRGVWSPELGYTVTETVFEDDFETDKGWTVTGAGLGGGQWQRGDPVGTMDGPNQANPEDDSPNDAGSQCYVTENGGFVAPPDANDVDAIGAVLWSPHMDLTGYKRAVLTFDLWYYDSSSALPTQDYGILQHYVNDALLHLKTWYFYYPTNGWATGVVHLNWYNPMAPNIRMLFAAYDRSTDHIVEMGVDNVLVEAERQVCDAPGVGNPPSGVGDTLRVDRSGGGVELTWQASPVDGAHDGAAYYELYASGAPDAAFAVLDTAATTSTLIPLDPVSEYYKLTAVNPAGSSGDAPAP